MQPNTIPNDNEAPEYMREKILEGLLRLPEEVRLDLLKPYLEQTNLKGC